MQNRLNGHQSNFLSSLLLLFINLVSFLKWGHFSNKNRDNRDFPCTYMTWNTTELHGINKVLNLNDRMKWRIIK